MRQIPIYAVYRLGSLAWPYIFPASANKAGAGSMTAGVAQADQPALSKRQEKLKARQEKGQVKVQYR